MSFADQVTAMKFVVINLLLFKLGWAAAVFSAAYGAAWIGALTILAIAGVNLRFADQPSRELRLLLAAAAVGLVWETLLVSQGVLVYAESGTTGIAPYWIVAMWILFATTLNVSMRWMKKNRALPVLFGGIGGPMSFLAGEHFGAVVFPDHMVAIIVISLGWAALVPLMLWIADMYNGHGDAAFEPALEGGRS